MAVVEALKLHRLPAIQFGPSETQKQALLERSFLANSRRHRIRELNYPPTLKKSEIQIGT